MLPAQRRAAQRKRVNINESQEMLDVLGRIHKPPIRVDISLHVQLYRLAQVDTKKQEFECNFGITMHWVSSSSSLRRRSLPSVDRFSSLTPALHVLKVDMRICDKASINDEVLENNVWRPEWYLANQTQEPKVIDEFCVLNRARGDVIWHQDLRGSENDLKIR